MTCITGNIRNTGHTDWYFGEKRFPIIDLRRKAIMKKSLLFASIVFASAAVFAGCSGGGSTAPATAAPAATEAATEAAAETKQEAADAAPASDEVYEIDFAWTTTDSDTDPHGIAATTFKKYAEEYSNGRIKVNLFPNGQMGQETDMIDGMGMGTIDAGIIANSIMSTFVPEYGVLDLPFIFADRQTAFDALDGELGQLLFSKLGAIGIEGLAYADGGFRQMYNTVRPIRTPEDLKGIKFRVMESPVYISMYNAFGSNPTPMAFGECFTALQQKTIDGIEIPIPVMYSNKYYEVTKYASMTNHTYTALPLLMAKDLYDSLPADLQDVVKKAAQDAVVYERQKNAENLDSIVEELKANGMEINEVDNPADFQAAVSSIYDEYAPSIGEEVMTALANVQKK